MADRMRVVRGAWLEAATTKAVFSAITSAGHTARAVGGTVRNALLGLPITDIDIATDARPETVIELAGRAGLRTIPTGLKHGTVTIVVDGVPFEVTTLRRDVASDGRRADVVFTDDWVIDASRRDFTINAIYCDPDGTVFDPLGGLADLTPPRIRFIGDAAARIREDYLRIMRFFRFTAALSPDGVLDPPGLAAAADGRGGLAQISGERIRAELEKLLAARHAIEVTRAMVACGVLEVATGIAGDVALLERLGEIERSLAASPDPMLRLAALAVSSPADARALDGRLKLSARDRTRLQLCAAASAETVRHLDERAARVLMYRLGADAYRDRVLLSWARSEFAVGDAGLASLAGLPSRWHVPVLPLSGADIVGLGVSSGPRIGAILAEIEDEWVASDFVQRRSELLVRARHIAMPG